MKPCVHERAALARQLERARRGVLAWGRLGLLTGPAVQRLLDRIARLTPARPARTLRP